MEIVFYILIFYGLLLGVNYFIICQRLLKLVLQYTEYEVKTKQQVPTEFINLFSIPISELETSGFKFFSYLQCQDLVYTDYSRNWEVLLYNQVCHTFATIGVRRPPESVNLFAISFITFFGDNSMLITLNGQIHGVIGTIPQAIVNEIIWL